jgi:hypothetical protein
LAITAFSQWSTTAALNVDLNNIPLDSAVMLASQIDDAFREMMKQLAGAGFATSSSASFPDNGFTIKGSADATKLLAFEVDDITTGTTRTLTVQNASGTIALTSDLVAAASTTVSGKSEFATTAEYRVGTDTARSLVVDQVWAAGALVTLTDAATVAVDMSTFLNATVTLGGNRALGAPSNTKVGQSGVIYIVQDGTGSRTLSFNAVYKFAFGSDPVLSTAASSVDALHYFVRTSTFIECSLSKGLA